MSEIKNRFTGEVIVSGDVSIKELVEINRANLLGADLSDADLNRANLLGADLSDANLRDADLSGANLIGADLFGANLIGATLIGANLRDADLYGADLSYADLSYANLYGADLSYADLSYANLRGANLIGANLEGELLTKAPIFIDLYWRVTITTEYMRIGYYRHKITDWATFSDEEIGGMEARVLDFWSKWKTPLLAMCEEHKK